MGTTKHKNRETGDRGEDIACYYLEKHGFTIKERNHLRKWGEIDIVAVKDKILHFIEVKSVFDKDMIGTGIKGEYRPEDNVTNLKQKKLRRVIQTYLNESRCKVDTEFRFHVITVVMNKITGKSKVKMLNDIIL